MSKQAMVSFANFDVANPAQVVNSPRSLKACKVEGVLPQELTYKPIEAFQERGLSPRLVKLRYDFFEAKRKDLLAAAKRAHEMILAEGKRKEENGSNHLALIAKESGLSLGTVDAINSGRLALEREKLLRAQENERNWLNNALKNELKQVQQLENALSSAQKDAKGREDKDREAAVRLKEYNERRQQEEERKAMEVTARQQLEKEVAREEFLKQQEELRKKQALEMEKQREAHERNLREQEIKIEQERIKQERREEAFREQEARKAEMRAEDLRRHDILAQQKNDFVQEMERKKEDRDLRIYKSVQANMDAEIKKREAFDEKQRQETEREERLMQIRAREQEDAAKKSFQQMMKRKITQDEANRKSEERRMAILEQEEETELRLLEHEQKKERYLDFKRELDALRTKNKEINVERQRRREEAIREQVAEQVRRKDEKAEQMNREKERLWQIRRAHQSEAYRVREVVKNEIMTQRVTSKYSAKALESKMDSMTILKNSTSLPTLKGSYADSLAELGGQALSQ